MTKVQCRNCGEVHDYETNGGTCPNCGDPLPRPSVERFSRLRGAGSRLISRQMRESNRRGEEQRLRRQDREQEKERAEREAAYERLEKQTGKKKIRTAKEAASKAEAEYYGAQTERFESFRKSLGGKIKISFAELFISLVIGIPIIVFFPTFLYLGVAIAFGLPTYFLFQRGYLRGPSKFLIILFTWLQFVLVTPQIFIALIVIWIGYFSMPTSYNEGDSKKAMEAWIRTMLGLLLSFNLYTALGGQLTFPPSGPQFPILLMALAFFFTFPGIKPKEGQTSIYIGLKGPIYSVYGRAAGANIFIMLMIVALIVIGMQWGLSATSGLGLSLIIFWFTGLFFGLAGGREGRPYTGVIVILFAIFLFSTQFSGVVGTSIFGQWWPQIQAFGETTLAPLNQVSTQITTGVGDAWLLLTNPAEYYRLQQQKAQASTSRITVGGTSQSIEITDFTLYSPFLDPQEPLLGSVELENKGEFDAGKILFNVTATWTDPILTSFSTKVGSFKNLICTSEGNPNIAQGTCNWTQPILQREIRSATFTFSQNEWKSPDDSVDLNMCLKDGEQMSCNTEGAIYNHSGETVDIIAEINFDYSVNVSIPLEIINQTLYENLLRNREITLQSAESQYSGGPIKATINTQRQPLRNKEESLIIASVLNEGAGTLSSVNSFVILVHKSLHASQIQSSQFEECDEEFSFVTDTPYTPDLSDYDYITCSYSKSVKPSEFRRVTFLIEPDIGNDIDRRTFSIIGLVSYTYTNSQTEQLQIVPAPST